MAMKHSINIFLVFNVFACNNQKAQSVVATYILKHRHFVVEFPLCVFLLSDGRITLKWQPVRVTLNVTHKVCEIITYTRSVSNNNYNNSNVYFHFVSNMAERKHAIKSLFIQCLK